LVDSFQIFATSRSRQSNELEPSTIHFLQRLQVTGGLEQDGERNRKENTVR